MPFVKEIKSEQPQYFTKVKHGRKRGRKEKEADIVAAHDSDTSNSLRLTANDASALGLRFSPRSGAALVS